MMNQDFTTYLTAPFMIQMVITLIKKGMMSLRGIMMRTTYTCQDQAINTYINAIMMSMMIGLKMMNWRGSQKTTTCPTLDKMTICRIKCISNFSKKIKKMGQRAVLSRIMTSSTTITKETPTKGGKIIKTNSLST